MRRPLLLGLLGATAVGGGWLLLAPRAPTSSPPSGPVAVNGAGGKQPASGRSRADTPLPRFTPAYAPAAPATTPTSDRPQSPRPAGERASTVDESVPEVHRPLYAAIRARQLSPTDKRAAMLEALAQSGPAQDPWARQAPEVFAGWQRAMGELGPRMSLAQTACYRAGCAIEVRFADLAAYQQAAARIRSLVEPPGQHGGRVLTPPDQRPGGEVIASWIMMAPAGS
jgi:hypothetical protein